jgi:hypothetical protein
MQIIYYFSPHNLSSPAVVVINWIINTDQWNWSLMLIDDVVPTRLIQICMSYYSKNCITTKNFLNVLRSKYLLLQAFGYQSIAFIG